MSDTLQAAGLAPAEVEQLQLTLEPGAEAERRARLTLRQQISKLESELAERVAAPRAQRPQLPRLLNLEELEQLRDQLIERLNSQRSRRALEAERQAEKLALLERMIADPEQHRWLRISNDDLGQRGCKSWHCRMSWSPRRGKWWKVKVSSGCPLARGSALAPGPRAK